MRRAWSTARVAERYPSRLETPVPTAESFVEYSVSWLANLPRPLLTSPANVPMPPAIPLPRLARPPIQLPLRMLPMPCNERETELATSATLPATPAPPRTRPAPAPTSDAPAAAMPRMLLDLMA